MPLIITPASLISGRSCTISLASCFPPASPLPQALEQTYRGAPRALRPTIQKLLDSLREGFTLTDALTQLGRWIPSFDAALLEAGETSGRLDATFKLLAAYYAKKPRWRGR